MDFPQFFRRRKLVEIDGFGRTDGRCGGLNAHSYGMLIDLFSEGATA